MTQAEISDKARENIQVIRDLMERSTVYRTVSGKAALVAGILSLAVAGAIVFRWPAIGVTPFIVCWLAVYVVLDLVNTWYLYRDTRARGVEFPSPQTVHAVLAMAPSIVIFGCMGLVLAFAHQDPVRCSILWVIGYGVALWSTVSFAPRSIKALGAAMLLAGFGFFLWHELDGPGLPEPPVVRASVIMAATFGLLHLGYGLRTGLIRRSPGVS